MKNILNKKLLWALPLAFSLTVSSCSDFLDKIPENSVEVESVDYSNTGKYVYASFWYIC